MLQYDDLSSKKTINSEDSKCCFRH